MTKVDLINLDKNIIINPYFSNNNYDIYIFTQSTIANIGFSKSCQGDIIIIGPGGDGCEQNVSSVWNGSGGIGSAFLNYTNLTFWGQQYIYKLSIPTGSIPSNTVT